MGRFFKFIFATFGLVALLALVAAFWGMSDLNRYEHMTPEQRSAEQAAFVAKQDAAAKRSLIEHHDGRHCLSTIGGEHSGLVVAFKQTPREPDSLEIINTRISEVDAQGNHNLVMSYRARNGFGGISIGTLEAEVKNSDCSFTILSNVSR
ncbi:hypothetical protein D3Y57_01015 (plasmid) [Sphingomonas paeninsulae]|uniref:Uncharacterized protein n=1 Tax=Sphingomonas paeninsulae TaxID=2319844 RepID=A0A494T750_SPHPE|nr:hypothetical protein [Sphingomonas paeninsulae]AYJ84700.1 hypothetical protein D3Y57_01015 [Sphingomonas paeninsulae]